MRVLRLVYLYPWNGGFRTTSSAEHCEKSWEGLRSPDSATIASVDSDPTCLALSMTRKVALVHVDAGVDTSCSCHFVRNQRLRIIYPKSESASKAESSYQIPERVDEPMSRVKGLAKPKSYHRRCLASSYQIRAVNVYEIEFLGYLRA